MLGTFWLLWKSSLRLFICFQHTTDQIYQEFIYDMNIIFVWKHAFATEYTFLRMYLQLYLAILTFFLRLQDYTSISDFVFELRNKLAIVSYKVRIVGF